MTPLSPSSTATKGKEGLKEDAFGAAALIPSRAAEARPLPLDEGEGLEDFTFLLPSLPPSPPSPEPPERLPGGAPRMEWEEEEEEEEEEVGREEEEEPVEVCVWGRREEGGEE